MARGVVAYDEDLMAWAVRYEWVCAEWSGKAGAMMGGGEYAFAKIDRGAA
jgi:hypothetical protein